MSGLEIGRKISSSLPSYERWHNFLQSTPGGVSGHQSGDFSWHPSFTAPNGVTSDVDFYNSGDYKHPAWKPSIIGQKYSNWKLGYKVSTNLNILNGGYLSVDLRFEQKLTPVSVVTIRSEQRLLHPAEDFTSRQEIVIMLSEEYRKRLIKDGKILGDSKNTIRITEVNGVRSINIETINGLNGLTELDEEKLREIQGEIQFDFEMKDGKTSGRFGDKSFTVAHADPLSLDPESIWNSLTGKSPFIFPVKVEEIDPK